MARGAPKGNKFAVGSKGGGRPAPRDEQWHLEKWMNDENVGALVRKIKGGSYSIRDVVLFRCLTDGLKPGGKAEPLLAKIMDKLLADLHELGGKGGGPLQITWLPPSGSKIEALPPPPPAPGETPPNNTVFPGGVPPSTTFVPLGGISPSTTLMPLAMIEPDNGHDQG